MAKYQQGIAGIWEDEHQMIAAARATREAGYKKFNAISPFPLHGIDEAMGIPRSFIPWVTFVMGLVGCGFGIWFTWWTSTYDWPVIVGGKPMWSMQAFIPIIFELTILFGALSSVAALIFICGLPKINPPTIDPDLTSHKFALFIPSTEVGYDIEKIKKIFNKFDVGEIKETEF